MILGPKAHALRLLKARLNTMATASILPEELLSLTLSNLDPKQDCRTVHSLRLSSRMFCRLSAPLLHRKIKVRMPTPGNFMKREDAEQDIATVEQLEQHPTLASFVKELEISQSHAGMIKEGNPRPGSDARSVAWQPSATKDEDRQVPKERVPNDDDDSESVIRSAAKEIDRHDARLAFFLLACKNLEVIRSSLSYHILGRQSLDVFNTAASGNLQARLNLSGKTLPSDYLKSIREVRLVNTYHGSIEDARTLLCLPALETLRMRDLADNRNMRRGNPPLHDGIIRNTNRVELIFDMCWFSAAGLSTLLQSCPNARALTMRFRPGLWNEAFSNTEVCDSIREHGRNLNRILFDCNPVNHFRFQMRPLGPYGSFSALKATWLGVPKAFFDHLFDLPADQRPAEADRLLPAGLKELYVLGVEENEMADMNAMVGVDAIPRLEKSVLVPWLHYVLEDRFTMHLRQVDYDGFGGFEIGNYR